MRSRSTHSWSRPLSLSVNAFEVPFTLRGQSYNAFIAPAQITDASKATEAAAFLLSRSDQTMNCDAYAQAISVSFIE
jgi:hypothetical protein